MWSERLIAEQEDIDQATVKEKSCKITSRAMT